MLGRSGYARRLNSQANARLSIEINLVFIKVEGVVTLTRHHLRRPALIQLMTSASQGNFAGSFSKLFFGPLKPTVESHSNSPHQFVCRNF